MGQQCVQACPGEWVRESEVDQGLSHLRGGKGTPADFLTSGALRVAQEEMFVAATGLINSLGWICTPAYSHTSTRPHEDFVVDGKIDWISICVSSGAADDCFQGRAVHHPLPLTLLRVTFLWDVKPSEEGRGSFIRHCFESLRPA